jgi:pimeloyl-ACP methyl ester carboxylesterase
MDPERIERDDRAWAAELARLHDPVQGSGAWRRLLPAIAADVANQPLLSARDLHGITAPTLVSCGDRDPFVPVAEAAALARQIHGGHLLVVPDAGHRILMTHPSIVGAALASFYRARASVTLGRSDVAQEEDPR